MVSLGKYPIYDSFYDPPPIITTSFPISPVVDALSKHDFGAVITDPSRFFLLFCKSVIDSGAKGSISFAMADKKITIKGAEHILENLQGAVEVLRKIFEGSLAKKRDFTILALLDGLTDVYFREPADCVDLSKREGEKSGRPFIFIFNHLIKPTMQQFAKAFDATCSESQTTQKIKTSDSSPEGVVDALAFDITWSSNKHFVYPIACRMPKENPNINSSLYRLYQDQKFCDLTLVDKDSYEIKMHKAVFYISGGDVAKNMLTYERDRITFPTYTIDVIREFVTFIYLGPSAIVPERYVDREVDIYQLLHMAHTHQLLSLVDCCTNIVTLVATAEDSDKIKELALLYQNDHLKQLHNHLSQQVSPL